MYPPWGGVVWKYSQSYNVSISSNETNIATIPTDVEEIEVWVERQTGSSYMLFRANITPPPFSTSDVLTAMIANAGSNAQYFYTIRILFKQSTGSLTAIKSVGSAISETFKVVHVRYR